MRDVGFISSKWTNLGCVENPKKRLCKTIFSFKLRPTNFQGSAACRIYKYEPLLSRLAPRNALKKVLRNVAGCRIQQVIRSSVIMSSWYLTCLAENRPGSYRNSIMHGEALVDSMALQRRVLPLTFREFKLCNAGISSMHRRLVIDGAPDYSLAMTLWSMSVTYLNSKMWGSGSWTS